MKSQTTNNRFSQTVIALALLFIIAAGLFIVGAQNPVQAGTSVRTNAAAQDLQMVLQEQERERIDQLNANAEIEALRARIAAAHDKQMVMQELEREWLDQQNSAPSSTHLERMPIFSESSTHGHANPVME
jgi:hypothetical protein